METVEESFSTDDLMIHPQVPSRVPQPREKSKRPQLSCNPCRARKVKCDRIQPCTACSLHQIAEICQYDLSEAERQPILQAEALKEKDKVIARLQQDLAIARGEAIKREPQDDDPYGRSIQKIRLPPKVSKKAVPLQQKYLVQGEMSDNAYFDNPGVTSVAEELEHLAFDRRHTNRSHVGTRGTDVFAFELATSYPFPTLWSTKDDTSSLIKLLPHEHDLFFYLACVEQRALSYSYLHFSNNCTSTHVRQFLENVEDNAALHPDMFALIFATLAQGLQVGVFDKHNGNWVADSFEAESKKANIYIAASMHCLRLASFLSRPTLLAVETLAVMGPYLTNSGKFLDASALFGETVRLAQSIGLHRDPTQLNSAASPKEISIRKSLWWWMLRTDQHYSMVLGRPLGISSMGDCSAPELLNSNPTVQSLGNYATQFTILGRQILSAGYLSIEQIDRYSDELLTLQQTLPAMIQFDETWLNQDKILPAWPLDVQAGVWHAKTHNLILLINRQRTDNNREDSEEPPVEIMTNHSTPTDEIHLLRGRSLVLESCRALLLAFKFFQTRVRAAMICWTMGQMAFNAAMILTLSMLETGETRDLSVVEHAYSTFLEMNKLGLHKLAGVAVERLGTLMKEFQPDDPANETVMGAQGMMLLEDPGLQDAMPGSHSPDSTKMEGGVHGQGMKMSTSSNGHRTEASQMARKKAQRKLGVSRDAKMRHSRKPNSKSERPLTDRRFSDGSTARPAQKRRANRSTPNLSLYNVLPGQSNYPELPHPTVKPETVFSPIQPNCQGFHGTNPSTHPTHDFRLEFETTPRPQGFSQPQSSIPGFSHEQCEHQQTASDPGDPNFAFSNQTTPGSAATNFFDETFQAGGHHFVDFDLSHPGLNAGLTPFGQAQAPFEQPHYSTQTFSISHDPTASYQHHY